MNEDYIKELYDYISSVDQSFSNGYSLESFGNDLQDTKYAASMYNWLGSLGGNETWKVDYPVESFLSDVKKKEEEIATDLPSEDGSLEQQEIEGQPDFLPLDKSTLPTDVSNIGETTPMDRRSEKYIEPMSKLGMYPSQEDVNKAQAQMLADITYTEKEIESSNPILAKQQQKEKQILAEQKEVAKKERQEVIQSPEFEQALGVIDKDIIKKEEDEVVSLMNDLYGKYGFFFKKTGFGDAMVVLADDKESTIEIDLDPFLDSTASSEALRLTKFLQDHAVKPSEASQQIERNEVQNAMKAKGLRNKGRTNDDGTESTVLMESAEIDGRFVAYPTLFPKNSDLYGNDPKYWMEKQGMEGYEEALNRNEVFYFDTEEEAQSFAEGSWKDFNSADAEADRFFKERGQDYLSYKSAFDTYDSTMDAIEFIDTAPLEYKDLTEEQKALYEDYYIDGKKRSDLNNIKSDLQKSADTLMPIVNDPELRTIREDFTDYMQDKFSDIAADAVKSNFLSKQLINDINATSLEYFGLDAEKLKNYTPSNEQEKQIQDLILTAQQDIKNMQQEAANQYEVAETFYDAKFDKSVHQEWVEGWEATSNSWKQGIERGRAAEEILKMSLGLVDIEDDATLEEVATSVIEHLQNAETGKMGRATYRYHSSRNFQEIWNEFSNNPKGAIELAGEFAANSFSQMLPYGVKILALGTAAGAATGATIGATGFLGGATGIVTTAAGARIGASQGFRSAFSAVSLAMEYTNSVLEAVSNQGYDPLNSEELKEAFKNDEVWREGAEIGFKRGIPIAVIDLLAGQVAGRVFKVGSVAGKGAKLAAQVGERIVFDPLSEATGELAAQIVAGQEIDGKEIFAEAWGGFGSKAPLAAVNLALDLRGKNNVYLANRLADINFMAKEKSSDTRISKWANNMERLGKISSEQNQRIQENIGLRREAKSLLGVGQRGFNLPASKSGSAVQARMMELLAAREELTSTTNRKEVFRENIKEINTELSELAKTKKLRPKYETATQEQIQSGNLFNQGFQANLTGLVERTQASSTDIRTAIKKYAINGKAYNRADFLQRVGDMTLKNLKKSNLTIIEDPEVRNIVNNILSDAIQDRKTTQVDVGEQATDSQKVGEEVQEQVSEEETFEQQDEVREEEIVVAPPIARPTKTDKENFEKGTIDEERLDGIISAIADKQIAGKKLTPFQKSVLDANKDKVSNVLDKKQQLQRISEFEEILDMPEAETTPSAEGIVPTERYRFSFEEGKVPPKFRSLKPQGSFTIGRFKKKKTINYSISGQELIDAGIDITELPSQKVTRPKVSVSKSIQEINKEIDSIRENTKAEVSRIDNEIKKTKQSKELSRQEIRVKTKELSLEKRDLKAKAKEDIDNLKSDLTQLKKEQPKRKRKAKVDFRMREDSTFETAEDEVEAVVLAMNELDSPNVMTKVAEADADTDIVIDAVELNERTDENLPSITDLEVIEGVPVVFGISDALTTGDVVNKQTGNTITNLNGGIGFSEGAWASVTDPVARKKVLDARKALLDDPQAVLKFWRDNPQYDGHMPYVIVKMGRDSIMSNEALFRVIKDNLSIIPEANKKNALAIAKQDFLQEKTKAENVIKNKLDAGKKPTDTDKGRLRKTTAAYEVVESSNSIEEIIDNSFDAPLGVRKEVIARMLAGSVFSPTESKPSKVGNVTKSTKAIPAALVEGMPDGSLNLVHLQSTTELVSDPQLNNVPQRYIIRVSGLDVGINADKLSKHLQEKSDISFDEIEILKSNHPNYPFTNKGITIGILENPVAVMDAYPKAFEKAMADVIRREERGARATSKGSTVPSKSISEAIGVGQGIPSTDYVGIVSNGNLTDEMKLISFLNIAFPSVNISSDFNTFNNVLQSEDVRMYLKGDEIVYGVTVDGDVYINPEVHNNKSEVFNTAIHEMGHVWTDYLQTSEKGRKIYSKGAALVKQTAEYKKQLKRFNGDSKKAVNETMAILIGNKGQTIADASLKSKFKEWLLGMWNYIKSKFTQTEYMTEEQIQNLTLDEFIGAALADIFAGKEIKLTDEQLKQIKNPDAAFSKSLSINDIINQGRAMLLKDSEIRAVLKSRGFKVKDINEALEYKVDPNTLLPREFESIMGGIAEAKKLFTDVRSKLNKWARTSKRGRVGKKQVKSYAEIRQKAMELMKEHPVFKNQTSSVQMKVLSAFDKTLKQQKNKTVDQELAAYKAILKQRKIGADNLKKAQTRFRNFVKNALPKSEYTIGRIQRLLFLLNDTNIDNFYSNSLKVLKEVEKQRVIIKRKALKEIQKIAASKAKKSFGSKNVPRSRGVDAYGQELFAAINDVMKAVIKNDVNEIAKLNSVLQNNKDEINEAIDKNTKGEQLTTKERKLLAAQVAYDSFADLNNASLEDVQKALEFIKQQKTEAILRFKTNSLVKADRYNKIKELADAQIMESNPELFDEEGNALNQDELDDVKDALYLRWSKIKEIPKLIKNFKQSVIQTNAFKQIRAFSNMLKHLGTLTNLLDRVNNNLTFFTDYIYRPLNRAYESRLVGIFEAKRKLALIATQAGIETGLRGVDMLLHNVDLQQIEVIRSSTGRKRLSYMNGDQLLRIYALSKNSIQRDKLKNQGITDDVLDDIATILGTKLTAYADGVVDFLSNEYYESVNEVYTSVNNVSLGYIENYFPTKTIQEKSNISLLMEGDFNGVFDAEYDSAFKERTDEKSDVQLKRSNFTGTLMNHIESMEKYKSHAELVQNINYLFRLPSVKVLLESTHVNRALKIAINQAINPQSYRNAIEPNAMDTLYQKLTGFALSFKAIQLPKQAISFINAYENYRYYPPNSNVPRVVQRMVDPIMFMIDAARVFATMGKDLVGKKGAIREAMEMSATFRERVAKAFEGDLYTLETGTNTFKPVSKRMDKLSRARRVVKTAAGSPTTIGDISGVMGYMINYKRNIANGMSKADALEAFNDYNPTQQTQRATEKVPIQFSQNALIRGFTIFGSTTFLYINKVMQSGTNILRAIGQGKMPRTQDIRAFYLYMAVSNALFTTMSNMFLFIKGDDEDKEVAMDRIRDAMLGLTLLYQIPIAGAAIESLDLGERLEAWAKGEEYKRKLKFIDSTTNPLLSVMNSVKKAFKKDGVQGIIIPAISYILGTQLDPFVSLFNKVTDKPSNLTEFDENMYGLLGVSPSYRPAPPKEFEGVIPFGGINTQQELKRFLSRQEYQDLFGETEEIQKAIKKEQQEMLEAQGLKQIGGNLYPIE